MGGHLSTGTVVHGSTATAQRSIRPYRYGGGHAVQSAGLNAYDGPFFNHGVPFCPARHSIVRFDAVINVPCYRVYVRHASHGASNNAPFAASFNRSGYHQGFFLTRHQQNGQRKHPFHKHEDTSAQRSVFQPMGYRGKTCAFGIQSNVHGLLYITTYGNKYCSGLFVADKAGSNEKGVAFVHRDIRDRRKVVKNRVGAQFSMNKVLYDAFVACYAIGDVDRIGLAGKQKKNDNRDCIPHAIKAN